MTGRLEGKVALITGAAAGLGRVGRGTVRSRGRAPRDRRCGRRIGRGRGGRGGRRQGHRRPLRRHGRGPGPRRGRRRSGHLRRAPRALQQRRRHARRGRRPRHDSPRDLPADDGHQREGRAPRLPARHPGAARERRRVHRQRGLVRRPHGRRHAPDRLHRVQGRGAGHDPRDRRHLRPPGHPGQRPLPGTDHDADAGQVPLRRRPPPTPPGPHPDGPLRRAARDRQRRALPRVATSRPG